MPSQANVYASVAGLLAEATRTREPLGYSGVPQETGAWEHVISELDSNTVYVHPSDPHSCLPARRTACIAAPTGARPSGARISRTRASRSGRSWSMPAIRSGSTRAARRSTSIAARTAARVAATADAQHADALRDAVCRRVMRMAQHPGKPDKIFAALEVNGVMRTTDGGETWEDCSDGLISLARAAAPQEQDRQRHLRPRACSTACDRHQRGRPGCGDPCGAHGPVPHRRRRQELAGHGGWPFLADDLWPRRQGVADGAEHALLGTQRCGGEQGRRGLSQPGQGKHLAALRQGAGARHDHVRAPHQTDPKQVYLAARYDGEVFGTLAGGATWQSMNLPHGVKDIYALACG